MRFLCGPRPAGRVTLFRAAKFTARPSPASLEARVSAHAGHDRCRVTIECMAFIDRTRISRTIECNHSSMKRLIAVVHTRTFAVVLEPEEEGGFTVRVPSLPEIVTYGQDEREALAMAEDAIRLVLEDCAARGEPVPAGEPPRIREVTVTLAA
jgi:antitoxin HicB